MGKKKYLSEWLSRFLIACCILYIPAAQAGGDKLSSLWLSYTEDENNESSVLAELSIALDPDNILILRAGQNDTSFLSETITTNEYYLGLSSFEKAPWSFDVGYEYWGKSGQMEINSMQLTPNWHSNDWVLGVNLEYKQIDLYTRQLATGQFKYETTAAGYGPMLQLYIDNWSLGLYGMWYSYEDDLTRLNSLYALVLLGVRNWTHTSVLSEWYAGGEIQYTLATWRLALSYSHSVAAVDAAESDTLALLAGIDMDKETHLELEVGRTEQGQGLSTEYAGVSLGFDF